jgi:hypothetical protein
MASNCSDGNFWYFCATEAGSGIPAQLEVVAIFAQQAGAILHLMGAFMLLSSVAARSLL